VLTVIGAGLTAHDFVAIQLFAAQLSAASQLDELRAELVRNERLAAVGEMSAVLAHEVRNPLGVIFNAVGGLRRLLTGAGDAPRALLDIVGEEADRLRRLVSDLLDFARPHDPQLYPTPLARIVDDALHAARQDPSFAERGPKLIVDVPDALPEALTDAVLLRRAIVNVLVNTFQHVLVGGEVRIEARLATEGWLRVRIANDGPPVRPEIAAQVFEPFVTAWATGTGLGLAVVRRIVEELRGRVQLDDGLPVSFSIWLPTALEDRLSKP
jgi:two-component system sensor histidine kinase HydH